jgi:hypothetical protein
MKACFPVKSKTQDVTKVFKVDEISIITDKNEISNGFCSYFCSISEKLRRVSTWRFNENSYRTLKIRVNPNNESTFEFRRVEPIEVFNELRQIKKGKATGYDTIPPNLIRDAAEEIATPLYYLVNISLQKSLFPSAEKYGKIVPIFKSGRRDVFDDYRPISILPVFEDYIKIGPSAIIFISGE